MSSTEKLIVIIAGNPASGKDTYAAHLRDNFGATVMGASDIIRGYAIEHDLPLVDRASFGTAHNQMCDEYGPHALADKVLEHGSHFIALSGLRVVANQRYLHDRGAISIALRGSVQTRYNHAQQDPSRPKQSLRDFWLAEIPEYFNRNSFESAAISVMNNAHRSLSIDGKSSAEVADEADNILAPQIIAHKLSHDVMI